MPLFDSAKHDKTNLSELSAQLPEGYRQEFEGLLQKLPTLSPYDVLGMSLYDPKISNFGKIAEQKGADLLEFISSNFSRASEKHVSETETGLGVYAKSSLDKKALNQIISGAVNTLSDAKLRMRYDRDAGVDFARSPETRDPYVTLGVEKDQVECAGADREVVIENSKTRRLMQLQLASELALAEAIAMELPDSAEQARYLQGPRRQLTEMEEAVGMERVLRAVERLKAGEYSTEPEVEPILNEEELVEILEHFKLAGGKLVESALHVIDGVKVGVEKASPRVERAVNTFMDRLDELFF